MQQRLERLENAKYQARRLSLLLTTLTESSVGINLSAITPEGSIKFLEPARKPSGALDFNALRSEETTITIPQTNPKWKANNLKAADKIIEILNTVIAIDKEKLTPADIEKLAEGLEDIVDNFRLNIEENRNGTTPLPNHAYDTGKHHEALTNSSVSDSYIARLGTIENMYIAPVQNKIAAANQPPIEAPPQTPPKVYEPGVLFENEDEIQFEDANEKLNEPDTVQKTVESAFPQEKVSTEKKSKKIEDYDLFVAQQRLDESKENLERAKRALNFAAGPEKGEDISALLTLANTLLEKDPFKPSSPEELLNKIKERGIEHIEKVNKAAEEIDKAASILFSSKYPPKQIAEKLQAPAPANRAALKEQRDYAEAKSDAAVWGMLGSGGVLGTAIVIAAILGAALTPVGWGILGGLAVVGLVGLVGSAIYGNAAEKEVDRIEEVLYPPKEDAVEYRDVSDRISKPTQVALPNSPTHESSGRPPTSTPGLEN